MSVRFAVARRALTKLGLADKYEGVTDPDGTRIECIENQPNLSDAAKALFV